MPIDQQKGFTLIELLIVVGIISILAAITATFFGDNVQKSRCTEGRSAVIAGASSMEKCRAIYATFNNPSCNTAAFTGNTPEGHFNVTLTNTANTFTLTATGIGGAAAASNTFCPTITLNELGVQGGTGSSPW